MYTETTKKMAWFWTDFVLQVTFIDNLNGAKSVTIKFNSVEPKVKYSSIKYTCMLHAIYRMQSPCGLASALALCRPTVPMV